MCRGLKRRRGQLRRGGGGRSVRGTVGATESGSRSSSWVSENCLALLSLGKGLTIRSLYPIIENYS